jgi:hypothetical protein
MIAFSLCCIAGILIFINLMDLFNIYWFGIPVVLIPEFHLDESNTISTYFLVILLALSSLLFGMIGVISKKNRDPYFIYWLIFAIIFLFASIDKMIDLRGGLKLFLLSYSTTDIWYTFSWIILAISLIAALLLLRFLLHLPSKDRVLLLTAAILFLGGAVGMDYFASRYISSYDFHTFTYDILITIESALEMLGSIVFIFALLNNISRNELNISVRTKR